MDNATTLPADTELGSGSHFPDDRGSITESYVSNGGFLGRYFMIVQGMPNSLRGVHVHKRKTDLVIPVLGDIEIWLRDLREQSRTSGMTTQVILSPDKPQYLMIPPGVAHGFLSRMHTSMVVSTNTPYDPEDDLACFWNDPKLGFRWSVDDPIVSERDRDAGSLESLIIQYKMPD